MALFISDPRRTLACRVLATAAVVATGCQGPPPPPERPTPERVAVSVRSIGIPYGPVVLLRNREQLIAVRVVAAPAAGYSIEYEWETATVTARGYSTDDRGTGMAEEERGFGVVEVGPVRFKWSRASKDAGWLYWPMGSDGLSVCSRTWASFDEIDLHNPNIHWYSQEMFRR